MTFMDEIQLIVKPIWKKCLDVDFLKEMGKGTLSEDRFLNYIIQDSLYLRDYIRAHAMAMFKSRTLKEMQAFYSVLGYVNDIENSTRLKYLTDVNLTDDDIEKFEKNEACKKYTDFLIMVSVEEDIPEILIAFIPCLLGYHEVFTLLLERYPQVMDSYFNELVYDYTSLDYKKKCEEWIVFVNEICEPLDENRKKKLKEIYIQSSKYELDFWKL